MKTPTRPDWFSLIFSWAFTAIVFALFAAKPEESHADERLKLLVLLGAISMTAGFIAMRRFKNKYKKEFDELGSPKLVGSPFDRRRQAFLGYIFRFRFLRLKDPVISVGFSVYLSLGVICFLWLLRAALTGRL